MSRNQIPTSAGQIIGLGYKMYGGLTSLGATLKITQITPPEFQTELTAFENAENTYNALRSARQASSEAFQLEEAAVAAWLGVVRGVLTGRFGARWSTTWAQAGFINHSTAVPKRIEDRIALAGRLVAFFTANPAYEVPTMNVTAGHGTALLNGALAAQQALLAAAMALATKDQAWIAAEAVLVGEMRALIKILEATLEDDDPRWLAFGLQMPATKATPGQPQQVTAAMDESGAIVVACEAVPLATRYRWRMLIVGVQPEYQLAARSVDPLATISNVDAGQTVEIIVQAVNGGLQGVASVPLVFALPGARTAEPKRTASAEAATASAPAPGNGNGHPRVARVS